MDGNDNGQEEQELNEYVKMDISHIVFKTVMHFINKKMDKDKYTIQDLQNTLSLVDLDRSHFITDYRRPDDALEDPFAVSSTNIFRIIESVYEIRENIALDDYIVFISSIEHPEVVMKWNHRETFNPHNKYLYSDLLLDLVSQNNKEKLINFIHLVAEIYYDYDYKIPTYKEWAKEIEDKSSDLGGSASLLFPIMIEDHKNLEDERVIDCETEKLFKNGDLFERES